jgi:hypothetical protein
MFANRLWASAWALAGRFVLTLAAAEGMRSVAMTVALHGSFPQP